MAAVTEKVTASQLWVFRLTLRALLTAALCAGYGASSA